MDTEKHLMEQELSKVNTELFCPTPELKSSRKFIINQFSLIKWIKLEKAQSTFCKAQVKKLEN